MKESLKVHGNTGKVAWNKGLRGVYSEQTLEKMRGPRPQTSATLRGRPKSEEHKKNLSLTHPDFNGDKNPNWRGGSTTEARAFRRSAEYRAWRKKILKRDKRACTNCGSVDNLEVHHIKSFVRFPELRLDLKNGKTLCKICHLKTDSYKATPKCA